MNNVKNKPLRVLKIVLAAAGIIAAILLGCFAVFYAGLCIIFSDSKLFIPAIIDSDSDGDHTAVLLALTSPEWPFGSQDGKVVLTDNCKEICAREFTLYNDGKNMGSSNWNVKWLDDKAEITIMGEEQPDKIIYLYYSGSWYEVSLPERSAGL